MQQDCWLYVIQVARQASIHRVACKSFRSVLPFLPKPSSSEAEEKAKAPAPLHVANEPERWSISSLAVATKQPKWQDSGDESEEDENSEGLEGLEGEELDPELVAMNPHLAQNQEAEKQLWRQRIVAQFDGADDAPITRPPRRAPNNNNDNKQQTTNNKPKATNQKQQTTNKSNNNDGDDAQASAGKAEVKGNKAKAGQEEELEDEEELLAAVAAAETTALKGALKGSPKGNLKGASKGNLKRAGQKSAGHEQDSAESGQKTRRTPEVETRTKRRKLEEDSCGEGSNTSSKSGSGKSSLLKSAQAEQVEAKLPSARKAVTRRSVLTQLHFKVYADFELVEIGVRLAPGTQLVLKFPGPVLPLLRVQKFEQVHVTQLPGLSNFQLECPSGNNFENTPHWLGVQVKL
eukprot:g61497.t1